MCGYYLMSLSGKRTSSFITSSGANNSFALNVNLSDTVVHSLGGPASNRKHVQKPSIRNIVTLALVCSAAAKHTVTYRCLKQSFQNAEEKKLQNLNASVLFSEKSCRPSATMAVGTTRAAVFKEG
jgi:hypothetical protein